MTSRVARMVRAAALAVLLGTGVASRADAQAEAGRRAVVEARLRQRIGQVVQQRLGLTEEQARRLGETSRRYEVERRSLLADEREQRLQLREELLAGDSANQERVGRGMDRLLRLQRQRLDLVEREQRDLAAFMTPVQRARYLAFQDEVRRRVEAERRPAAAGGQGRRGARPRAGARPGGP